MSFIRSYKLHLGFHNNGRKITNLKTTFFESVYDLIKQYYNYTSKLHYNGDLSSLGKSKEDIKRQNHFFYGQYKKLFTSSFAQNILRNSLDAINTSNISFYQRKKSGSLKTNKSRPKKIYFDDVEFSLDSRMLPSKDILLKDNNIDRLYWISLYNPFQKGNKLFLSKHDSKYIHYKRRLNLPVFIYDEVQELLDQNIPYTLSLGKDYIKIIFTFSDLETLKLHKRIKDLVDEVKGLDFGKYISTKDSSGKEEQFDLSRFYKRVNSLHKQISKLDKSISELKNSKNFGKEYLSLKEKRRQLFIKISELKKHTYRFISKKVVTSKTIVVEKLTFLAEPRVSKNYKGRSFNKMINIMSRGLFIRLLEDRCLLAGSHLLYIDPKYTSQTCSICGHRDRRNRQGRLFNCQNCHFRYDADLNAAHNILNLGIKDVSLTHDIIE